MPRKKSRTPGRRRRKDPHARREAARYEKPIASRELILEVIAEADRPLDFDELQALLGIRDEDSLEALRRRLKAMTRDGQLVRNRRGCYGRADRLDLVAGRVIGHQDGYGFLVANDEAARTRLGSRARAVRPYGATTGRGCAAVGTADARSVPR